MDPSFSSSLELNGMSSATAVVVWIMIAFLIILVAGIGIYFYKEFAKKRKYEPKVQKNNEKAKGF